MCFYYRGASESHKKTLILIRVCNYFTTNASQLSACLCPTTHSWCPFYVFQPRPSDSQSTTAHTHDQSNYWEMTTAVVAHGADVICGSFPALLPHSQTKKTNTHTLSHSLWWPCMFPAAPTCPGLDWLQSTCPQGEGYGRAGGLGAELPRMEAA